MLTLPQTLTRAFAPPSSITTHGHGRVSSLKRSTPTDRVRVGNYGLLGSRLPRDAHGVEHPLENRQTRHAPIDLALADLSIKFLLT